MTGMRCGRSSWAGSVLIAMLLTGCATQHSLPTVVASTNGPTRPIVLSGIDQWRNISSYDENTLYAGEGVAAVTPAEHGSYLLYRGILSVPKSLAAEGWGHIGDPDSTDGYVIDAYQGPSSGHSKMFLVTMPSGAVLQYVHALL